MFKSGYESDEGGVECIAIEVEAVDVGIEIPRQFHLTHCNV
jgi:hypothetical protein